MKSCSHPESFGHGYGINRDVPPDKRLTTAIPAMKGVSRNPGDAVHSKGVGRQGLPYFQGSKISKQTKK